MSKTSRPGIRANDVPRLVDGADPTSAGLTPADFFLLSRIDGHSDVHTLSMVMGQSDADVTATLQRLVEAGMVSCGDAKPAATARSTSTEASTRSRPAPEQRPSASQSRSTSSPASSAARDGGQRAMSRNQLRSGGFDRVPTGQRRTGGFEERGRTSSTSHRAVPPKGRPSQGPPAPEPAAERPTTLSLELAPKNWTVPFGQFTFDPSEMSTGSALTDEQKQVVLYFHYHLRRVSYYDLMSLPKDADRREVKRAYFALSKAFHPDRWFRKDVGLFGERIEEVFKWLNRAYGVLGSPRKRKGYDRLLQRGYVGEWQLEGAGRDERPTTSTQTPPTPQAPTQRSTGIIEVRARQAAAGGDWAAAADLYQRALKLAPTSELRIRMVECMLKANLDPSQIDKEIAGAAEAERDDARLLALEAEVARRIEDFGRARRVYERILEREPDNPVARLGLDRLRDDESHE